jgi:4-hydroxy-tetrahydrodipicolinate reductase
MRIALLGYGKMGHIIEGIAPDHGIEITERFDVDRTIQDDETTRSVLEQVRVLLDFSIPDAVCRNIEIAAKLNKQLVIGTTGWYDHLPDVKAIVKKRNIGLVYASNFSLGINLFYKVIERAGELFQTFGNYDCFIEEAHHQFKKDAPSGTALTLRNILEKYYKKDQIPVTSVRAGYFPGTHSVGFDSNVDTISLKHTARSREGLAQGAILAAKWIEHRKGIYVFSDVLESILNDSEM